MKTALITGITGQDGRYLSDMLIQLGYKVVGLTRNLDSESSLDFRRFYPNIEIAKRPDELGELISEILNVAKPDEIYNLSAFSSVAASFGNPIEAASENGVQAVQLFEACRLSKVSKSVRVYQAGSSEMFGSPSQSPQTELTSFRPNSPYGAAKAFAHNMAVQYRENYGLQISNGIMYNHESPYRSTSYVSKKITSNVAKIKQGRKEKFTLGNIDGRRDWGYAGDYVKAMHAMLQSERPDDFIVSSGKSHSVREFLEISLKAAGLDGSIEEFVDIDFSLQRPADSAVLVGDNTKAKMLLNWTPETSFEDLVQLMLEHDLRHNV